MKYAAIIYIAAVAGGSLQFAVGWHWIPPIITPTTIAVAGGALLIAYAVSRRQ